MALTIYNTDNAPPKPLTCFVYGRSRIGKTTFAATFPRPVFLVAGIEGNEATLNQYPGITVIRIDSTRDMDEALKWLLMNKSKYDTVIVDSLTFYCDMFISEIVKKTGGMQIQDWQKLDLHVMKYLVPSLHTLGKHVVWVALEQEMRKGDSVSGYCPMLYGKAPQKVPATTDLILRMNQKAVRDENNKPTIKRIMELESSDAQPVGSRYGKDMSDPFIEPHFDAIASRIGNRIGVAM